VSGQWTEARKDCRAGFYQRKLQTQAGEVELNIPKLRYVSGGRWGTRRYLDMNRLKGMQETEVATADNAAA
jgi:hypothetical protein